MRAPALRYALLSILCVVTSCGYDRSEGSVVDASGGGDGAAVTDANPSASDDAAPGGADAAVGIACGGALCTGTQLCCSTLVQGVVTQTCTEPNDCQGQASSCDGPEDCGENEICCESSTSGAACQVQGPLCQFELCHTAADCSDPGQICCTLQGRRACTSGIVCPGPPT